MEIIITIATVVIAGFAVTNYLLAIEVRSASEKHQQEMKGVLVKMNEILTALVKSNYRIANLESQKEIRKELKEREIKERQKFVTGGK